MRSAMAEFDRLPLAVRRRLNDGPYNYNARALAGLRRRHRLGEAELLAVIDALDGHARTVLPGATPVTGANRLESAEPDEAMLLAAARKNIRMVA